MPQHRMDNQDLLDRAAIHDLLARYFQGIDRGDWDQVQACFTEDVQTSYHGRPAVRGVDMLMNSLRNFRKSMEAGELKVSTHFMGNLNINFLEADAAETETNAIAFLVRTGEPPEQGAMQGERYLDKLVRPGPLDQVAIRSLRYLDKLRRTAEGWRISERVHTLDWSCQVPANFAVTRAQRVTT